MNLEDNGPDEETPETYRQLQDFYSWQNFTVTEKKHYLDWGSPLLNKALLGVQPGDSVCVCGAPNHGKTISLTSMVLDILKRNENVLVLDFTLDDPKRKRFTQYAANLAQIDMNVIDFINLEQDGERRRRHKQALCQLELWLENQSLALFETATVNRGERRLSQNSTGFITETLIRYRDLFPEKKIVVLVDALNNVATSSAGDEYSQAQEVSDVLKRVLNDTQSVLLATHHLRKNNGRRPTMDDLKGNNYLAYEMKVIIGLHNDLSVNGQAAEIYYVDQAQPMVKVPVIEWHFLKNKCSDYKGVIFARQWPAQARVEEMPLEAQAPLMGMLYK